jgi:hypothetical protein
VSVGDGSRAITQAQAMVTANVPLPVWIRRRSGQGWTYMGRWRPRLLDTDTGTLRMIGVGKVLRELPDR